MNNLPLAWSQTLDLQPHQERLAFIINIVTLVRRFIIGINFILRSLSLHLSLSKGNQFFHRSTYKSTVTVREDLKPGDIFEVKSYLCVGSVEMVVECLLEVQIQLLN